MYSKIILIALIAVTYTTTEGAVLPPNNNFQSGASENMTVESQPAQHDIITTIQPNYWTRQASEDQDVAGNRLKQGEDSRVYMANPISKNSSRLTMAIETKMKRSPPPSQGCCFLPFGPMILSSLKLEFCFIYLKKC